MDLVTKSKKPFKYVEIAPGERMILNDDIDIIVKASKSNEASIKVKRKASGFDNQSAKERASNVIYDYKYNGNKLIFNDYYIHNVEDKVKGQEVDVTLFIPENTEFTLDENLYRYFYTYIDNDMDLRSHRMVDHTWKLKNNELICLDCKSDHEDAPEATDEEQSEELLVNVSVSVDKERISKLNKFSIRLMSEFDAYSFKLAGIRKKNILYKEE